MARIFHLETQIAEVTVLPVRSNLDSELGMRNNSDPANKTLLEPSLPLDNQCVHPLDPHKQINIYSGQTSPPVETTSSASVPNPSFERQNGDEYQVTLLSNLNFGESSISPSD
jgi:hypothetical protein